MPRSSFSLKPLLVIFSGVVALSVHASPFIEARQETLPIGWTAIGCYSDSTSSRTLDVASYTDVNNMTIESCIAFCTPAGYLYAGVEYTRECYCDNVIESPGAPISSSDCDMACTGNATEICGGPNAINIFESSPPQTLPTGWTSIGCYSDSTSSRTLDVASYTDVNSMTIESCIAFCTPAGYVYAGVEYARECYCANVIESPGAPISSSDCNMACAGNANEICGGPNAIDIFQSSPPPATTETLPTGWSATGCYSDSTSSRTLNVASYTDANNMTIESCIAFCTPAGYVYAGVEYARECYCGNVIESPGVTIASGNCNMPCTGKSDEICGGSNAIDIFQNSNATVTPPPPPPPPPAPIIVQTPGTFQYQGCYQDAVNGAPRSLQYQLQVSGGVTAESCTAACSASDFILAGLEYGQECWCDSYMALAVLTPNTDCDMPCVANTTELCGAGNRLAIYVQTTAPPITPTACLGLGNPFTFDLVAVFVPASPGASVSAPVLLGSIELAAEEEQPSTLVLGSRLSNDPHVYSIGGDGLSGISQVAFNSFPSAVSVQPLAGGNQYFEEFGTSEIPPVEFTEYCPQPNPLSSSSYIGPPVLGIDGQTNIWAICGKSSYIVYLPSSSSGNCSNVLLAMTQGVV